ncbi:GNAT family N-acetyltransferase [Salipaludibacillus sp. HK11]|uniref:GNAT family N-acetyltransferase n=1 Tax=Salipaludibacillus sp. HK11 TaxID=3394320 RepID=UPI0039FCCA03
MVELKSLKDPQTEDSIAIQRNLFNSDSTFNQIVFGKNELSKDDLIQDNAENLQLGAQYFYIVSEKKYAGLVHFLPVNPHDGHAWIGLLIIHKKMQKSGIGNETITLLEDIIAKEDIKKIRLSVQQKNEGGAEFWQKKGYVKVNSSIDKFNNDIDIYEKELTSPSTPDPEEVEKTSEDE